MFGVRRFYQSVDDQLVTLFGLNLPQGPSSIAHYYVASAGAVDANGWACQGWDDLHRPRARIARVQQDERALAVAR